MATTICEKRRLDFAKKSDAGMSRKSKGTEDLEFCTIKCKLSSILQDGKKSPLHQSLQKEVQRAHDLYKLGSFFFKAFCLSEGVPQMCHSTAIACLQQVSTRSPRGVRCKATELVERMERFWTEKFQAVYPDRVDTVGRSRIKQVVAEEMVTCTLTNATSHFKSRCMLLCSLLGLDKKRTATCVDNAFRGRWDLVDEEAREALKRVLPSHPSNASVYLDMKKRPSDYVLATYRLCQERAACKQTAVESSEKKQRKKGGNRDFCFAPLRTDCIPKNLKIDTETLAQISIPYKETVAARKEFTSRSCYNDWVWNRFLDRKTVDRKLRNGFTFHHQISTDGVSASILYSRPKSSSSKSRVVTTKGSKSQQQQQQRHLQEGNEEETNEVPSKTIGLDPGKKNVATLTDADGVVLKYTARQRNSESKLVRFRRVLAKEKKAAGIYKLEAKLSEHSHRTNDEVEFWSYLEAKRNFDIAAREFYEQRVWRNWRLRIYSARKSSEDKFLGRVSSTYGKYCHIFYGDWSMKDQMLGCEPSPSVGMRKAIEKKFTVTYVDEYLTSRTCNKCMHRLSSYLKRDGKRSYSRLCCQNCKSHPDRSKLFVSRDVNAAANILLVGNSLPLRPEAMRRKRKRSREEEYSTECAKRNRPAIGVAGTSSDPLGNSISQVEYVIDADMRI